MYFPAIPTEGKNHQEFREAANKRFTTSKSAIAALRRIGKPRLGGFYVWSDPDREIGTVFNVILSLAKNLRTRPRNEWQSPVDLIFDNWLDLLYPWFLHLMEDLILGGSDPTTPTGLYVYDGALSMIPYFCSLPDPEIDRVIIRIVGTTPRFGSLATKVLLKTLDRNHFAWRFWAILMARLVSHHQTNPEKPKLEMNVFENLKSARAVFIRHLYRELLRVHTMDHEELLGLNSVLFLYRVKPHGEGKEPLTADEVDQRHALRVLVRLLSSFLRMRKKSMVKLKEETAMWLMQLIDVTMDGNLLVEEAVDAGLVVALLKAHPFYFSNYHSQLPTSFAESAARLLSEIAKFFGFPSVLHRFLQSVKVISRSEFYEERLRRNSKLMWRIWEQVITKATLFRAMRSSLKAAGDFWRCDNLSCDHSYVGRPDVKFRCCTGCSGAFYCSKSCQRVHWYAGHQKDCPGMRNIRNSGVPGVVTASDLRFFQAITQEFLNSNRAGVNAKIDDFINTIARSKESEQGQLSEVKQLIVNRVKNPIVVVEYFHCWTRSLLMEDCTAHAPDELHKLGPTTHATDFEQSAQIWKSAEVDSNSLYVIVLMPMTKKTSTIFPMFNRNWNST